MMTRRTPVSILVALLVALGAAAADEPVRPVAGGGWIGVILGPAGSGEGVGVDLLVRDGPADRAGLRGSDRIVAVDGEPVADAARLVRAVNSRGPGDWIALTVERGGEPREIRVRIGSRPENTRGLALRRGWAGLEAIELPPDLREHFGAPREAGVMLSAVTELGPAAAAGLRLGDVVHEIDGRPVRSRADLASIVARSGVGNTIELRAARDGAEIVFELLVEDEPEAGGG